MSACITSQHVVPCSTTGQHVQVDFLIHFTGQSRPVAVYFFTATVALVALVAFEAGAVAFAVLATTSTAGAFHASL